MFVVRRSVLLRKCCSYYSTVEMNGYIIRRGNCQNGSCLSSGKASTLKGQNLLPICFCFSI